MSGPNPVRLQELAERHGVSTTSDNRAAAQSAPTIVLSVKPQSLVKVASELRGAVPKPSLMISILAGVPMWKLDEVFEHTRLVRAMPNTPAHVGQGITVWTATPEVSAEQQETARRRCPAPGLRMSISSWKRWLTPVFISAFHAASRSSWSSRPLRVPSPTTKLCPVTWHGCAIRSRPLAAPRRRPCTTSTKRVFARRSRARCGQPMSARCSWARG
jgi:hypothetical protein